MEPAQLELALVPEAEVERRLSQRSKHRSLLRSAGDHRCRLTGDSAVTERLAICPWWRWPTVAGLTERQPSQMRLEGSVTEGDAQTHMNFFIMASSPPVVASSSGEPPAQSASQPALP